MKKYAYIISTAVMFALAVSCTSQPAPLEIKLDATPKTLRFAAESATAQTVTVTAENTNWEADRSELGGWLTLTRDGDRLSVSAADNYREGEARNAEVIITPSAGGIAPVVIKVSQNAKEAPEPEMPSLSVSSEKLTFAAADAPEQVVLVTVRGDFTWKAAPAGGENWIHIESEEGLFAVTVDDNPTSLERNTYINVSPSDKTIQTGRIYVTQEAAAVPPSIEPVLPDGTTPEEGLVLPFTTGNTILKVSVIPEDAQWSASIRYDGTTDNQWLSADALIATSQNRVTLTYKLNEAETSRTAYLVLTHADSSIEPVEVKVTQKAKTDVYSTIYQDINTALTQARIEVKANNDWRDYPFVQWMLTFYSEELTYNRTWGRWEGSGERMRILLLGSPQQEEDVVLEEMTYEVVPYDDYNQIPITNRQPGWVCGSSGDGTVAAYPSGSWYQVFENGKVTDRASTKSGSVTVTRSGDEYTITWDLTSDADCKVTGSYTGPIEIIF